MRTRRSTAPAADERRATSSQAKPKTLLRGACPRLASPPTAEERVRRTNEYRASRSRARAYRDGLRAAAVAARGAGAGAAGAGRRRGRARAISPRARAGSRARSTTSTMWTTLITSTREDADGGGGARAAARVEGLADELVYPGGLTTFEDSDEDARAAQRCDGRSAPSRQPGGVVWVLAALAISLLAIVARIVSDAAAAALEGVAEVRSTLSAARSPPRSSASASPRRAIYRRRPDTYWRALAEDALEAAVAASRGRGGCRVGARAVRPPRDALIRARWPLAGAKRRAASRRGRSSSGSSTATWMAS